jgi:translation initiation factor IF-3
LVVVVVVVDLVVVVEVDLVEVEATVRPPVARVRE